MNYDIKLTCVRVGKDPELKLLAVIRDSEEKWNKQASIDVESEEDAIEKIPSFLMQLGMVLYEHEAGKAKQIT
jgi:hypothetical protein